MQYNTIHRFTPDFRFDFSGTRTPYWWHLQLLHRTLRQGAQGSIHRRRRRYHLRGMRGIQGLDTWKIWEIGQPKWFFHMF